jgi:hypothetical protein
LQHSNTWGSKKRHLSEWYLSASSISGKKLPFGFAKCFFHVSCRYRSQRYTVNRTHQCLKFFTCLWQVTHSLENLWLDCRGVQQLD